MHHKVSIIGLGIKSDGRRKLMKVDGILKNKNYVGLVRSNLLTVYETGNFFSKLQCSSPHISYTKKSFLRMKIYNFWKADQHKVLISIQLKLGTAEKSAPTKTEQSAYAMGLLLTRMEKNSLWENLFLFIVASNWGNYPSQRQQH